MPLLAVVGIVAVISGTASAAPSKKGGSHGVKVRILSKSQASIARKGVLVKVTSRSPRKVRLSGASTSFDDGSKRLTKSRVVRFRSAGTKVVKLPLSKAGRRR